MLKQVAHKQITLRGPMYFPYLDRPRPPPYASAPPHMERYEIWLALDDEQARLAYETAQEVGETAGFTTFRNPVRKSDPRRAGRPYIMGDGWRLPAWSLHRPALFDAFGARTAFPQMFRAKDVVEASVYMTAYDVSTLEHDLVGVKALLASVKLTPEAMATRGISQKSK